jgi:shikimate dehydrogenase
MGMRQGDPLPVPTEALKQGVFVGDVVTMPAVSPLIAAARAAGCKTSTGTDMSNEVCELIVDFLVDGIDAAQALRGGHGERDADSTRATCRRMF